MKKNKVNNLDSSIDSSIKFCEFSDFGMKEDYKDMSIPLSQSVMVHKQNSRQGTLGCKGRAELTSRSNKKPWKQKGTGRARAGTPRSPLWRGGGVSHGPQMRVRKLSMPKRIVRSVNTFLVSNLIRNKKLISLNWTPNRICSVAKKVLKTNGMNDKKITILYDLSDFETYYSFPNIENVKLVSYDAVHPYAIVNCPYLMILEKDNLIFKSLVESWQE